MKKKKARLKVPKTVQQSIPYTTVYADNGIIETTPGRYTKSFRFSDINYEIARTADADEMFLNYCDLINMFDSSVDFQITINNKTVDRHDFAENTLLGMKGDDYDELREEYNEMLTKKISEGQSNITREKYITVSVEAEDIYSASLIFTRLESDIVTNFKRIGGSKAEALTSTERLEILHNLYNLGYEDNFGYKSNIERWEDKGGYNNDFDFKTMAKMGLTTKDIIGPPSMTMNSGYIMLGEKYASTLYMSTLASSLSDKFVSEISATPHNSIVSMHIDGVAQDRALRIIKNQIVNVQSNILESNKNASKGGYSTSIISPDLQNARDEAEEMFNDMATRGQKMFLLTFTITHFADSIEELKTQREHLMSTARRYMVILKPLTAQQEDGFNTSLPLGTNKIEIKRSLTTESTAAFIPFSTQDIDDARGFYYGVNAVSKNLLLVNRALMKNGNGFILGTPGSGKSFAAKEEMLNVILNTDDDVIVIDPEAEYVSMAKLLGGEEIRVAAGGSAHLNPMEMDREYADADDPITLKADFLISLIEIIKNDHYGLTAAEKSILDRCVKKAYEPYNRSILEGREILSEDMPTLKDLYEILIDQGDRIARDLAQSLEIYATGSQNLFAHKANVTTDARFVVYNVKDLGKSLKTMGMMIILDAAWNRMIQNRRKNKKTWIYIDEAYLLFKNENTANFLQEIYKRSRKWGGSLTAITQNVSDMLQSQTAATMLSNSEFVLLLNQAPLDRSTLAAMLHISETQTSFVTNSDSGQGLIVASGAIVPFINQFPRNTKMYRAMTTNPEELAKMSRGESYEQ